MNEYRVRETGELKTKADLLNENSNVSFPKIWSSSVLDFLGVDVVNPTNTPQPSGEYVSVVRNGAEMIDGAWFMAWTEVPKFAEYTDDDGVTHTVAEQQAAFDAENTAIRAASERMTRDSLLKETDHFALSDVTMSAEMAAYRQALRDVPQQAGFPSTITWPTKPE